MYGALLDHPRPRPVDVSRAAGVRLRRRRDAGRGAARLRGRLRLRRPGGLRAVGDLAGRLFNHAGRRASPARSAPRSAASRCGIVDDRRPRRRGRRARRDRDPRPQRDEGLLGPARGHRRGDPGRLVPLRRHRPGRRGRLLLHRRPQEGPDHPRRLQRLPARDRGGALRAPGGGRGGRDRHPAPGPGRGGRRRRRAASPGATATPEELRDLRQGPGRGVQVPPRTCGWSTPCPRAPPARSSSARSSSGPSPACRASHGPAVPAAGVRGGGGARSPLQPGQRADVPGLDAHVPRPVGRGRGAGGARPARAGGRPPGLCRAVHRAGVAHAGPGVVRLGQDRAGPPPVAAAALPAVGAGSRRRDGARRLLLLFGLLVG